MRNAGHVQLTGSSPQIVELKHEIERVARSDAKVLITGESGVGKELVAREVHARSLRADRTFVPVNCAGIPETLLESELFGHVRGSFTDAYRDKPGKLELAHEGTLFLDEVGEMTPHMQGLLLRFLETGELQKVGADRGQSIADVRVIAATNRSLSERLARGLFREDLYYRLAVIHLHVPPLRARRQDIVPIAEHFLRRFSRPPAIASAMAPEALSALTEYDWPGNVRELENVMQRLVVVNRRNVIQLADLPEEFRGAPAAASKTALPAGTVHGLYDRIRNGGECFWDVAYPLYMQREITRAELRDLVEKGLEEARGSYKILVRLFNMDPADYKRFLNFLRKHQCQLPFKAYRRVGPEPAGAAPPGRMASAANASMDHL